MLAERLAIGQVACGVLTGRAHVALRAGSGGPTTQHGIAALDEPTLARATERPARNGYPFSGILTGMSEPPSEPYRPASSSTGPVGADTAWSAESVRRLRGHLGLSQGALAARIGTKQQTISEWETGTSRPRRMSRRLLQLVAEESGFYDADPAAPGDPS